jgi:2-keto-3-deoxy-L-rhamnonate aldolase RhmA
MEGTWESSVKRRLRESQPVFGCTITTTSLDVAARAASAGFHFLWLEMEHSPLTLETVRNIVLATRDLPAPPFARRLPIWRSSSQERGSFSTSDSRRADLMCRPRRNGA